MAVGSMIFLSNISVFFYKTLRKAKRLFINTIILTLICNLKIKRIQITFIQIVILAVFLQKIQLLFQFKNFKKSIITLFLQKCNNLKL